MIFVEFRLQVKNTPKIKRSANFKFCRFKLCQFEPAWCFLEMQKMARRPPCVPCGNHFRHRQRVRLSDSGQNGLLWFAHNRASLSLHCTGRLLLSIRAGAAAAAGLKFQFFVSILTLESVSLSGGWACKPPCGLHNHVTDFKTKTKNL